MMKKENNNKRIGIYVRVSTEEQSKEGLSIQSQINKLQDYAQIKDWWVYKIYNDSGYSGKSVKRPAFQEMIKDAKNEKFNLILVYKLDRFSRNLIDVIYTLEELSRYNIEFVSMNESFDTSTAIGRAFMKIISIFAELEREQTTERINMVLGDKIKDGMPIFQAPYGYKFDSNKKWVVDNRKANIVKSICQDYLNKVRFKDIIIKYKINKDNYYSIIKNAKNGVYNGKVFYYQKLRNVRGIIIEKKPMIYDGKHPHILNEETYEKIKIMP